MWSFIRVQCLQPISHCSLLPTNQGKFTKDYSYPICFVETWSRSWEPCFMWGGCRAALINRSVFVPMKTDWQIWHFCPLTVMVFLKIWWIFGVSQLYKGSFKKYVRSEGEGTTKSVRKRTRGGLGRNVRTFWHFQYNYNEISAKVWLDGLIISSTKTKRSSTLDLACFNIFSNNLITCV